MGARPKITDLEKENGVLSSISLNLDKQGFDEQFESFMDYGNIRADIYSLRADADRTFIDKLGDSVNPLTGQKVDVFSDGTKIVEGTFNQYTGPVSGGQGKINFGLDFNEDMIQEEGIPRVEDLPSGINSGDEFAEAFDIRDLSFKVVKEAKEKVKNTSQSEAAEAAKESQYRNNFEMPEKPPGGWPRMMNSTSPGGLNNKDARDTVGKAAEAAKDKGIIQLVVVAVVIAGTLGAYVWRNN